MECAHRQQCAARNMTHTHYDTAGHMDLQAVERLEPTGVRQLGQMVTQRMRRGMTRAAQQTQAQGSHHPHMKCSLGKGGTGVADVGVVEAGGGLEDVVVEDRQRRRQAV